LSTPQVKQDELISQLAAEIRILEGSVATLQSRLNIVRSAINEVNLAHATLEGLMKLQDGDDALVPVGAGSYVRMKIADSKKLVMGIGAGTAMEKDIASSVDELKSRILELDKASSSIQQQLDQVLARYDQDREALNRLLQETRATQQTAT
jgi:prefoldin alpha subunit